MSVERLVNGDFWRGKKVFITGHTGFKGSWLSFWLKLMGAKVYGYALSQDNANAVFNVLRIDELVDCSTLADIRDLDRLKKSLSDISPEVVFHLAAQSLVRESHSNPVATYATNVMGTVNILDAIRKLKSVRATVVITTDKCYENKSWPWGYREIDPLGGKDPYSNSKACAELVVNAYRHSFFNENEASRIATARAGNVLGGGDVAANRLVPDIFRALEADSVLTLRNSSAVRPWQFVLDSLYGYLLLAESLFSEDDGFGDVWNFGPTSEEVYSVGQIAAAFMSHIPNLKIEHLEGSDTIIEEKTLRLDSSKARAILNWRNKKSMLATVESIFGWHKALTIRSDMRVFSESQINEYWKK